MSVFHPFRLLILAGVSVVLSACITLPGHRQTVDEENFFMHINAPNLATKKEIRFNAEKTELLSLPEGVQIELVVADHGGEHQLLIQNQQASVVYHYRFNGRKMVFGDNQQQWFARQIPFIMAKAGLK